MPGSGERLHRALPWLVAAQFLAGTADHALLIVILSMLLGQGQGFWWAPLLKIGFTLAYVALAPWAGTWVDRGSKSTWMQGTHVAKLLAVVALLAGATPLLCFVLVGVAAALYAPARYGWVTEVTPGGLLVRANAWLEVGLVGAGLLGTVFGGALISPAWRGLVASFSPWPIPHAQAALFTLAGCYALAWACNARVPASGWHAKPKAPAPPRRSWPLFWQAQRQLWSDRHGGQVSLAATSLFWGVGAALQMLILQWASHRLALPLHQAAYLQALVAVGMVVGAVVAGRRVKLTQAMGGLRAGLLLGVLVPLAALTSDIFVAAACLGLAGAVAGYAVIPLNALLQHRGVQLLTPGRSIAVQVFNENLSILCMLGAYTMLVRAELSPVLMMWWLGMLVAGAMALLMRRARQPLDQPPA